MHSRVLVTCLSYLPPASYTSEHDILHTPALDPYRTL